MNVGAPRSRLVKRFVPALLAGLLLPFAAGGQTSSFANINVAGSFNGFETLNPNMALVDNNVWQADLTITNTSFVFKFATANFAQNWGVFNQPHSVLPQAMIGIAGANDIQVVNNNTNLNRFRFTFNDVTREYAVFLLDNQESNLLFNTGFETAGSSGIRAKYWEIGNPNTHGGFDLNAQRQGSNWNTVITRTGQWVGLMAASWAGSRTGTWWQEAPIEPGLLYQASAYFRIEATNNVWKTASNQVLKLEFFDYNRTSLLAVAQKDLSSVTNIWVEQSVSAVAPANAAWARLAFFVDGVGNSGTMWMDDVSLKATSAKRSENFNDWQGAAQDDCYTRSGWTVCTGRTVVAYTNAAQVIPLARSGSAASLKAAGSYVQSPRFADGIGTVTFFYRHGYQGSPTNNPDAPVNLRVERSQLGSSWVTIAQISNIISTGFTRFDVYNSEPSARFIRIVHAGGSTNRVIIDDITTEPFNGQPRLMTFNSWTNATTVSNHFHLGWRLSNGLVSAALALDGLAGQIAGSNANNQVLLSPTFNNGYGTISFQYRLGGNSTRSAGFAVEATTNNGTSWTTLDTVTNITALGWSTYNRFALITNPAAIRIRNLAETNIVPGIGTSLSENFDGGATPPPGWTFTQIGVYTANGSPSPALRMDATGAEVISPSIINPTQLVFWTQGQSIDPSNELTVEAASNGVWVVITNLTGISSSGVNHTFRLSTNMTQLRFSYVKTAGGNLALDNIRVTGAGLVNPPPQNLALENVDIGNPEYFRLQNFDTWPSKPSPNFGTTFHQGWELTGSISVVSEKAFSGQAAAVSLTSGGGASDKIINFEGDGETKGDYSLETVSLSGISWRMTNALIGTSPLDWKIGGRSVRMRGFTTSELTMLENVPSLSMVRFSYARYGTDSQIPFVVELSTNNGANWNQIGPAFTGTATPQVFEYLTNLNASARIRIRANATSTSNRRLNIDDIILSPVVTGGPVTPAYITSHFMPEGFGGVSFRYRHGADTNATGPSVMGIKSQISTDGITWQDIPGGRLNVSQSVYRVFDIWDDGYAAFKYFRIAITSGTGTAHFDDIDVFAPRPPANVLINTFYEPAQPFTNDAVTLFATIIPEYGARDIVATSRYATVINNITSAWTAIGMALVNGSFQSTSAVPPQAAGTKVLFEVTAHFQGPGALDFPTTPATASSFYLIPRTAPGLVWINEVDYFAPFDDGFFGEGSDEFIEIAGQQGVNITDWRIDLVVTGYVFASYVITNSFTFSNEVNGYGFFVLGRELLIPTADLIMDDADLMEFNRPGLVRLHNELGGIEDQIAYGGSVVGQDNIGAIDADLGLDFISTSSVSRIGIGSSGSQFTWDGSASNKTPGSANLNQTFATAPLIGLNTNTLTFSYIPGSIPPPTQSLIVSNAGGSALAYSIGANVGWLVVNPTVQTGLPPGAVSVHTILADPTGLTGNRQGNLTISGVAANSPVTVTVNLLQTGLPDALVAYPFDDGAGDVAQNFGTAGAVANLTLTNASFSLEGQGASGLLNDFAYRGTGAVSRAASTGAVAALNSRTRLTVTGWLKPTGTGGVHRIIGNRSTTNGFALTTSANYQELSLFSSTNGSPAVVTSTNGLLNPADWTFFAMTFDAANTGSSAVVFYRGTTNQGMALHSAHSRGSLSGTGISTSRLFAGGSGTDGFNGLIDDLQIHTNLLDTMTIEAIRQAGANRETGAGAPPQIDEQPQNQSVPPNGTANFFVDASGLPLPQYQWRKFGIPLTNQTSAALTIGTVQASDAGSYDVVVFNAYGSVTSQTVTLSVDGAFFFVVQPESRTVYEGENVLFTGTATSGTDLVTYRWTWGGTNITGATNATLWLTNVTQLQQGAYRVVASNGTTAITSGVANLTVVSLDFDGLAGGGITLPAATNRIVITWPSISNRLYDVLRTTNLMAGTHAFVTIASNLPATPSVNVYTDTVQSAGAVGVYRINAKQP